MEPLASLIDTIYMGHLDTRFLAALGIAAAIFNSAAWTFNFLVHISTQAIGLHLGKQNQRGAMQVFQVALVIALILGSASSLALWLLAEPLLHLAGSTPAVHAPLSQYFHLRLWGLPLLLSNLVIMGALRAHGRVHSVLAMGLVAVAANAAITGMAGFHLAPGHQGSRHGNPRGPGPVPAHRTMLLGKGGHFWPQFFQVRGGGGEWLVMSKNSLHFFGRSAALTAVFFSATRGAAHFGTDLLAVHHIIVQLWLFSAFFVDGLAVTATILATHYSGENHRQHLRQLVRNISLISLATGTLFLLTYVTVGPLLWPLLTSDPLLWPLLNRYWPLISISQPTNALAFIADGILFGMGAFHYLRPTHVAGHPPHLPPSGCLQPMGPGLSIPALGAGHAQPLPPGLGLPPSGPTTPGSPLKKKVLRFNPQGMQYAKSQ